MDDYEKMQAEADEKLARMERDEAAAFGLRAPGDEHRAWVDHDAIEKEVREDGSLQSLWGFTGLAHLNPKSEGLPPDLRRLLLAREAEDFWVGVPAFFVGPCIALGLWLHGTFGGFAAVWASLVIGVLSATMFTVLADWVADWTGKPFPLDERWRILRAVAALREHPFVVVVDGTLIENLPAISWLDGRDKELYEAADEARDRKDALEKTAKRIREARKTLGEKRQDVSLDRIAKAVALQEDLEKRIARLRADIAARRAKMRKDLESLRARVDLEALRSEAAALTGQAAPYTPERIAAEIEVDLGDLHRDFSRLRSDIDEQKARFAAMNEVSAISP